MAKKRRKHEEEEEEFKLPEFDEKEFLRKELVGAKVMLVAVILAVAAAILSYLLSIAGVAVIAFFAGLALVFLLPYVVKGVGIDLTGYTRRDWLGHGTTFFFAWLAIWVLLLNVPFADVTPPNLDVSVERGTYDSSCVCWLVNSSTTRFNVSAIATDNAGIRDVKIVNGTSAQSLMYHQGDSNVWTYAVTPTPIRVPPQWTTWGVTVTAEDTSGHTVSVTITVKRS